MKTYFITFAQIRRYGCEVTAGSEYEALAEAVNALYRGELEAHYATLDYFEAEALPEGRAP